MNLRQKLQFIRANHYSLFEKLEKEFPAISEDEWNPSGDDIATYNTMLKKYCENYNNDLYRMLKL